MMAECPEDKDMLDMANEELIRVMEEEKRLQNLLLKSLLPKDDADERDHILEVGEGNNTSIHSIRNEISFCTYGFVFGTQNHEAFLMDSALYNVYILLNLTKKSFD
jgi:hypothetical protein